MATLLDSEAKGAPTRSRPNPSEVGRRGRAIYARDLQDKLEAEHRDRYVAINVDNGQYALGDSVRGALAHAHERWPGGVFYVMWIGHPAVARIG